MSEYQYESTFDTTQTTEAVNDNSKEESSQIDVVLTPTASTSYKQTRASAGDLAAFVSHVSYLENKLRAESGNVFFDTENEVIGGKVDIGEGASFRVQRAEWREKKGGGKSGSEIKWGKYVALKAVRAKSDNGKSDWRDVISEVRALLHEPLRYHPNVVRLLGLGWGPSADSSSVYPQLIMEFSEIGSMDALQKSTNSLPFAIKQKLCYDVGRGLSILHACGIIHGDLNHRNVLIFTSKIKTVGQPYTAKLSDFGGSIMDMATNDSHLLRMTTWPYSAPEIGKSLTEEGIKKTDVYSFGLFIWKTVLDGSNILQVFGLTGERSTEAEQLVSNMKLDDSFLLGAKRSIYDYAASKGLHEEATVMTIHAFESTIQHESANRDLARTQCVLMNMGADDIPEYLQSVNNRNERAAEQERTEAPGRHGITPDSLGAGLGRMGHDYDPQNNKPGYRPRLSFPEAGEFLFEPLRLKSILDWPQQQLIVREFERAISMGARNAPVELQPHDAAFYLFQCYLHEFGVTFNAEKIVQYLSQATDPDDAGGVVYYAQAWIWRISNTFNVPCPKSADELETILKLSILRGHRTCLVDGEYIRDHLPGYGSRQLWDSVLSDGQQYLNKLAAGLGMPYFATRKLRKDYNLNDIPQLDNFIREDLGEDYDRCLKVNPVLQETEENENALKPRKFESIFVNHIGHGLLHFAASMGNYEALLHMIFNYHADINVRDQTAYETPLVCACRSGNLKSAILLLECGADPNVSEHGIEPPLYWLCSFKGKEMADLAQKLVEAGAEIDGGGTNTMGSHVRAIWADWEQLYTVSVTNLGRAVLMNNLEAVKVLLSLGADPLAKPDRKKSAPGNSAINVAAVLNMPEILETLLLFLNSKGVDQSGVFNEGEMLLAAHNKSIIPFDTTLLQSRIVRHGSKYKSAMFKTLKLLRSNRATVTGDWRSVGSSTSEESTVLCQEVKLGNTDIVEHLLELGHSPNGSPGHRPLEEAVKLNHKALFKILIGHGANIFVKHGLESGSQLSLLQIFADRPKSSRPGLFIAQYLINAKVPVDSLPDGARSAFVLAVLAQDFELANLLVAHGADINHTYQLQHEGSWFTVLGELVQTHTAKSLASIEYLLSLSHPSRVAHSSSAESVEVQFNRLGLGAANTTPPIIDFIVDKTNQLSVLHVLARCSHESINNTAQISVRIINTIMKTFKLQEQIDYCHQVLGTPLCVAASTSNLHMVSALLDHKARIEIEASRFPPEIMGMHQNVKEPANPLHIALLAVVAQTTQKDTVESAQVRLQKVRDGMQIIESLYHVKDMDVSQGSSKYSDIQKLGVMIENQIKTRQRSEEKWKKGEGMAPMDLSTLKDYEEPPWKEGDEMNSEQAIATMLKYMR